VRIVRYAESPLGRDPTQIDYADYRVVDGVQIPFRVMLSEPEAVSTVQLQSVEQNVQNDDTRFPQPQGIRSSTSPGQAIGAAALASYGLPQIRSLYYFLKKTP